MTSLANRQRPGRRSPRFRAHKLAGLLAILWSITPLSASAQTLEVGLHIRAQRLDLAYAQTRRTTDISSLDLVWNERLNNWLDGTLILSKFRLTQDSNPIPAGQSATGTALGLGLRFALYRGARVQLHTALNYRYSDASADTTGQSVDYSWHQGNAEIDANLQITDNNAVNLGVGALLVHGSQTATGSVVGTERFDGNTRAYGRLALILGLDPGGQVGLEVDAGAIEGGRIYFQRQF